MRNFPEWHQIEATEKDATKSKNGINPSILDCTTVDSSFGFNFFSWIKLGPWNPKYIDESTLKEYNREITNWIEKYHVQIEIRNNRSAFTENSCKTSHYNLDGCSTSEFCKIWSLWFVIV